MTARIDGYCTVVSQTDDAFYGITVQRYACRSRCRWSIRNGFRISLSSGILIICGSYRILLYAIPIHAIYVLSEKDTRGQLYSLHHTFDVQSFICLVTLFRQISIDHVVLTAYGGYVLIAFSWLNHLLLFLGHYSGVGYLADNIG